MLSEVGLSTLRNGVMSSPPAPGPAEEGWSAGAPLECWREAEAGVGTGEKSIMRVGEIQTGPRLPSQETHSVVLFVTADDPSTLLRRVPVRLRIAKREPA